VLSEKGLKKILEDAYKRAGFTISIGETVIVAGKGWTVKVRVSDLPAECAVKITELVGYIPTGAMNVCNGCENQLMLNFKESDLVTYEEDCTAELEPLEKIPLIYAGRYQLFQRESGNIVSVDTKLMKIINWEKLDEDAEAVEMYSDDEHVVFFFCHMTVVLSIANLDSGAQKDIEVLGETSWTHRPSKVELENTSLFDDEAS